jgi:predicted Kef-type K+ transport protein
MTAILNLAVALLAGLLMTRIFSRWHLPDVTAFLVTGVLIGPFVLGRLGIPGLGFASYDQVEALSMISDVAMGFIAFSIGNEFRLSQLKKTGRQAMIIGVLQALAALAGEDIHAYAEQMFEAGADLTGRTAEDVFSSDFKAFSRGPSLRPSHSARSPRPPHLRRR